MNLVRGTLRVKDNTGHSVSSELGCHRFASRLETRLAMRTMDKTKTLIFPKSFMLERFDGISDYLLSHPHHHHPYVHPLRKPGVHGSPSLHSPSNSMRTGHTGDKGSHQSWLPLLLVHHANHSTSTALADLPPEYLFGHNPKHQETPPHPTRFAFVILLPSLHNSPFEN